MRAGNPMTETEEIFYALREINPDVGIIIKKGEIIMTGNRIKEIKRMLNILHRIEEIESINKYETEAVIRIRSEKADMLDILEKIRGEKICVIA